MCSDHFSPWSRRQGQSAFAWSWLGAALATTELTWGTVSAPGQRYHPAVHAQAIATLGALFPGRFWVALGSGEASNEHITGDRWPRKEVRTQRLEECVDVIRRLLDGEEVSHDGLVTVDRARLWELADPRPRLVGPAVSLESAARVAAWSDGMVTVNQPLDRLREMVAAHRDAGGTGPLALQVHLSWAPTEDGGRVDRPRPVAQQRLRRAGRLGPRDGGRLRRGVGGRDRRAGAHRRRRVVRPGVAPRPAGGVRRARLRRDLPAPRRPVPGAPSSTRSASTCSPR